MAGNIVNLDYLRKYMEKKGISEFQLAKLIGVDYTMVYRVFRGERNPGSKFIAGLMKSGLDLELDKIFLGNELPAGNKEVEKSA